MTKKDSLVYIFFRLSSPFPFLSSFFFHRGDFRRCRSYKLEEAQKRGRSGEIKGSCGLEGAEHTARLLLFPKPPLPPPFAQKKKLSKKKLRKGKVPVRSLCFLRLPRPVVCLRSVRMEEAASAKQSESSQSSMSGFRQTNREIGFEGGARREGVGKKKRLLPFPRCVCFFLL